MLKLLLQYSWQRMLRYFRTRRSAKIITIGLFSVLFLSIAVGIYLFFKEGFYFISSDLYFREAFSLYVYEMYLLVFVSLVVFSTFISSLFVMFRRKNDDWVVSTPGFKALPVFVFARVAASALWPFFIIIVPALLAIRKVFELGYVGFSLVFFSAIMLEMFIVLLVLLFAITLSKAMLIFSRKIFPFHFTFKKLVMVFMICVFSLLFFSWQKSVDRDLIELFGADNLGAVEASVNAISQNFQYLPSHIVAAAVYSWQSNNIQYVVYNLLSLTIITSLLLLLWTRLSGWFLDAWMSLQEGNNIAKNKNGIGKNKMSFHFSTNINSVLFKKEALVFMRDIRSLLWMGFLFLVWFLQAALNSVLSKNMLKYGLDLNDLPYMVIVLQFVTGIYFISAFVLRFVFPTFGSERSSAWLLATAPIDFAKIYWAKLWFFVCIFTTLGLVIVSINLSYLGMSPISLTLSFVIFITSVIFVIVYGLSLGAMFPNFETDDPSSLSTSLPGLSFIIGSLMYGALGGLLLYETYIGDIFWWALLFELVTIVGIFYLVKKAPKKFSETEFVKIRS